MPLSRLNDSQIEALIAQAQVSPRRRCNLNLHGPEDTLQRMINVMIRGTYCQPHKHENPDKLEIFTVLRGEALVPVFNDAGEVVEVARLSSEGPVRQVEIPPRTWHTVMALSPVAVLYEVIEGRYDPATHKRFASFAPGERDPQAGAYLAALEARLQATLG